MNLSSLKYFFAYVCAAIAISGAVYTYSYRTNLDQLSQTGSIRIEQARDRLLGQLASFRQLPNLLAKHPRIKSILQSPASSDAENEYLLNTALLYGVDNIVALGKSGTAIASSNFNEVHNYIGNNYAFQPHVKAAMNGRLGFHHALDASDGSRDFYFARNVILSSTAHAGVIVVQVDVASLEFEWHIDSEVLTFFDRSGVVFVTNRQSLGLLQDRDTETTDPGARLYSQHTLKPFLKNSKAQVFDHSIWNFEDNKEIPAQALVISKFIPQIEMTARIFLNTANAKATARLQALLVASVLALIGLGLWALYQRRQRLADLLVIEEAANAKLEARVEKRTEQLHKTQHQLIQAGKLTAMGQMSAGISHELNQPMAAIQNFAESGEKLMNRGRDNEARNNFKSIAQQIDRMSRITQSLRAFARKEKETIEPVDLQNIISESIALASVRCEKEGVEIVQDLPSTSVLVMGGHVRLQQVVINLITNAIDAILDQPKKTIKIKLSTTFEDVRLTIHDSGPGCKDTSRVFEPFYSTKEIGASKGLGLGLSISYGIVGSFGGDMKCRNHPSGGAEFTVILKPAKEKLAA